jgi:hypothetical protein
LHELLQKEAAAYTVPLSPPLLVFRSNSHKLLP